MTFNSYLFIFIFLPVTVCVFRVLQKRGRFSASVWFLIAASLFFYGSISISGLVVFVLNLFLNWIITCAIFKNRENKGISKRYLTIGISLDLGLLALFKYFGDHLIISGFNIEAPGISFYTFCEIMLLTECFRGSIGQLTPAEYGLFLTFFPKLAEGPILRPKDFLPLAKERPALTWETAWRSFFLFSLGLFKKVILADTLGAAVDFGFESLSALHTGEALVVMLSYTLQLYFDFSGYCDMASAVAALFGFELPLNFNAPYRTRSITEFWDRWHITLTRFFTYYVYIPLGGSREGKAKTYRNILLIFLLSGLWHGKGWTFLVWGLMHGLGVALTRFFTEQRRGRTGDTASSRTEGDSIRKTAVTRGLDVGKMLLTFLFVNIAWVFFRAPDMKAALRLFSGIGQWWFPRFHANLAKCFQIPELWYALKVVGADRLSFGLYLPMALILAAALLIVFFAKPAIEYAASCRINLGNTLLMTVLFTWCVLSLEGVQTYLYVNF